MTANETFWKIALGAHECSRHTYARQPSDEYRLLGCAKRGLQFGALAINRLGQYVLINGDHVTNKYAPKPLKLSRTQNSAQPLISVRKRRDYQQGTFA